MISADVQRVKLDAKERSLLDYQRKCQELRDENERLLDSSETQEHDSQVVLKFLREDAERKDELIESLKSTIQQQRDLFVQQREEEAEKTSARFGEVEERFRADAEEQQRHIDRIDKELRDLQEFKEQKAVLEETMQKGEQARVPRRAPSAPDPTGDRLLP